VSKYFPIILSCERKLLHCKASKIGQEGVKQKWSFILIHPEMFSINYINKILTYFCDTLIRLHSHLLHFTVSAVSKLVM